MAASFIRRKGCIFCSICDEKSPAKVLYKDDRYIAFEDIKPATKNHFLVIPLDHIHNVKELPALPQAVDIVNDLVRVGEQVLKDVNGDSDDCRMGFHWPPFNSISHLHLHVMSPVNQMSFLARTVYKPDTFYFATPEATINWIKSKTSSA